MSRIELIKTNKKFIHVGDLDDPESLKIYDLIKVSNKDEYLHGTYNGNEIQIFLAAACWPIGAHKQLIDICTERQRLLKAYNDSMSLVYQLRNTIACGELE
jgi:hypothetical protein